MILPDEPAQDEREEGRYDQLTGHMWSTTSAIPVRVYLANWRVEQGEVDT